MARIIYGPDVASYQGDVDWAKVKANGAAGGVVKATEGIGYVNPFFASNWKNLKANGLIRGAYHFGRPGLSAIAQADFFVKTVGKLGPGDWVALDIETADHLSPVKVDQWVKAFVDRVQSKTGLPAGRVVVYTGAWFWNPQAGGSSIAANHPLWLSGYTKGNPPPIKGWKDWTFWQYTSSASTPGIKGPHDDSFYNGTLAQLRAWAGVAIPTPKPKPVPVPPPAPKPVPAPPKPTPPPAPAPKPTPAPTGTAYPLNGGNVYGYKRKHIALAILKRCHDGSANPIEAANVRRIQKRLNKVTTGRYDAALHLAVLNWQKAHTTVKNGVKPNGAVDAATWKALGL